MATFSKGDRVRFTFACPTAPPIHAEYVGAVGTVEEVQPYVPTIKNVYGQDINNPSGNVTVRLDGGHRPFRGGGGSYSVIHVFAWELERLGQ